MPEADLVGVYITDDYIDVILGSDAYPNAHKTALSELTLDQGNFAGTSARYSAQFGFGKDNVEAVISACCAWIKTNTKGLRSVGVACYGPFESLSRVERQKSLPSYGRLQSTSHGHRLGFKPLAKLFREGLTDANGRAPLVTMETDVAAAVAGEIYLRTFQANGARDKTLDDQVFAFVKVSLGIGAAFMRASTSWQGRLHPEAGQIMVPRWTSGYDVIDEQEAEFVHAGARNPGSIEALASVGAINARCRPYTFNDLKQNPNHMMWQREAYYLAHMLWNLTCIVSPHAIVMGGRVMSVPGLIDRIRTAFSQIAGDASFPHYGELANLETYITICANPQGAEIGKPGVIGALCLAAMETESLE